MKKPAAVIFDMDGVLVDSEPYWLVAMNDIFSQYGVHLEAEDYKKTTGLRLDQVIEYWKQFYSFDQAPVVEIADKTYKKVLKIVCRDSGLMPGAKELIQSLKNQSIPIALASSSSYFLINGFLEYFGIKNYFDVVQSAEDFKYGKPNPEVFLAAAEKLGIENTQSIVVIEDSLNGLIAAKSARMICVLMPERKKLEMMQFSLADKIVLSLEELKNDWWSSIKN